MFRPLSSVSLITLSFLISGQGLAQPPRTDIHGDPLPQGAIARLGTIRWRADGNIVASAILDAKTLLTVTEEQLVQIWDATTGKELRRFDIGGAAENSPLGGRTRFSHRTATSELISISRDGKTIANVGNDLAVHLWDVDTGKALKTFSGIGGRIDLATSVGLSGNGQILIAKSLEGVIKVWKTNEKSAPVQIGESPQPGAPVLIGPGGVDQLSFDGKTLLQIVSDISGRSLQPRIVIWDTATGKVKQKIDKIPALKGSQPEATGAAISPDLKTAALHLPDGLVFISLVDGKRIGRIDADRINFSGMTIFSPDGKSLIGADEPGGPLTIWKVPTGEVLKEFRKQSDDANRARRFRSWRDTLVSVSSDGRSLLCSTGPAFTLIDLASGKFLNELDAPSDKIAEALFAENGTEVFTRAAEAFVRKWDAKSGKQVDRLKAPDNNVREFVLSPNGRWFVARVFSTNGRDLSMKIFDAISLKEECTIGIDRRGFYSSAVFSADSKYLAFASQESRTVEVFRLSGGEKLGTFKLGHVGSNAFEPFLARFSPTGKLLFVASDRLATIWEIAAKRQIGQIPLGEESLKAVVASPDDRTIALETSAGTSIWELATYLKRLSLHQNAPTGMKLTFGRLRGLDGSNAQKLTFSRDGRLLARVGDDRKIRIFDTWTGKQLGVLDGHHGNLMSAAFSPDGKKLVTGSADTTALVWDMQPIREQLKPLDAKLDDKDAEDAWHTLNEQDAAKAHAAIRVLAGDPAKSVAFLRDLVGPASGPDAKKLEKLIADLGNPKFAVREKAHKELDRLGEAAAPALRKAAESNASAEVRKAAKKLVDNMAVQPLTHDQLRLVRVVEVLEHAGTPEAIELLKKLASGAAGLIPTPQAQAALDRLNVK